MRKIVWMTLALCLIAGAITRCTNASDAERILKAEGFTQIEFTGYRFFMCGRGDFYHTGFRAMHYAQQPVTGAVCSGLLFKGSTIRFD